MMKIAFITLGYRPLRTSGLDVSGERLVDALLKQNHQVTVIAGRRGYLEEIHCHPDLRIYRIPLDETDWIGFAYRAARYLSNLEAFDVVHFWDVHFGWAYRGKYIASLQHSFRQRLNSIRSMALTSTWLFRYMYYNLARYLAEIPAVRRAQGLIAGSSTTRIEFIDQYGVDPERVLVARHGVDTDFFRQDENSSNLREQLSIRPHERVILFVGFITPRKGIEHLVRALPLMSPSPKLVLVGMWRNDRYRRQILDLLDEQRDRVIEAGFVPDELMPAYYSMADVYVSSTLLEGFGIPIAEALACETPVVTTEAGSTAEVLGPGGIIVPQRDPEALAQAISSLLENASLRKDMGKKGRSHILREFSLEKMLQDTLSAYERFS